MSVTLRKRKNKDGSTTLRIDIFHFGQRRVETLKHLRLEKPTTPLIRAQNKEKLRQAEAIVIARAAELQANDYGIRSDTGRKTIITDWMQNYINGYTKTDKRNMQGALNRFRDFLKTKRKDKLTFGNLTSLMIDDFINYLNSRSAGEGATSYYRRFKKMLRRACKKQLLSRDILDNVEVKAHGEAAKKDILTLEEIKVLAATPTESKEVRRAFLFCCMTGLRWVDVKALKWYAIHKDHLKFKQHKTGKELTINLNDTAIFLLGSPGDPDTLIFDLPTANGANKTLKAWVRRAGIDKKITWHNARHSFGTNLIFNKVDIVTASKLLGHTSLRHTQRYVDSAEELKRAATDKLNLEL